MLSTATKACVGNSALFFFFNDTATTEIYTLSLHDALPIYRIRPAVARGRPARQPPGVPPGGAWEVESFAGRGGLGTNPPRPRSEEHTSELQSQSNLVCRLLLEKKKNDDSRCTARQLLWQ